MNATLLTCSVWEDAGLVLLARVLGAAGVPVTPDSVGAASVRVFDAATGLTTYAATPAPASVLYATLQTGDPRWTADVAGYNLVVELPGTAFPEPGQYRAEIVLTPIAGSPLPVVAEVTVESLYSS